MEEVVWVGVGVGMAGRERENLTRRTKVTQLVKMY